MSSETRRTFAYAEVSNGIFMQEINCKQVGTRLGPVAD